MSRNETWVAWSEADLDYLRRCAGRHKKKTIAARLRRSVGAVEQAASKMGVSLAFRQSWRRVTTNEIREAKLIATKHPSKSSAARAMGISRTRFIYLINMEL